MKTLKILTLSAFVSLGLFACSDDDDGDITANDLSVNLYATSNTSGNVTAYKFEDDGDIEIRTLLTNATDAEGIYVDTSADEITIVNRSNGNLETYDDLDSTDDGDALELEAGSPTELGSPRDVAVSGNIYVVADNMDVDGDEATVDNRLWVYSRSDNTYTLTTVLTTDFAVWGIEFVGNDLYAVVDKTSDVALFENFTTNFNVTGPVTPTKRVTIEGIVRTHGIGFDDGTMILTDIGDAMSDSDGGFHIISNFESKYSTVDNGGTLAVAGNQVRVAGSNTFLGNPVNVDYDAEGNTVYIAERANGSGRILAFVDADVGGNIAPTVNNSLNGASSVYYSED
ncbi:hypothetical protein [Marinirhabdus gelatinilytica]|uniref:NHL repeat-containing protein n=1 Tax=Marinirhabdus gelatinilytica TaxID=1703343 RepID=A0A370QAA0_9FLAO|nr:hypothetical protein [Marinirhabdus gelatinilytica]RDK85305.1 hypothetical protein C8D94_103128 [Marinirhabdus gelatinilytica]